ncbi:unnamed protein product [Rotaria socialis]|uniref:V-type proton ATPase subunit G n=1 Tax=Rotaria socialis TaxID=392032 RepID=A0A821TKB1_9BILA|nr:unnamed protein product [Rotaria socialis]
MHAYGLSPSANTSYAQNEAKFEIEQFKGERDQNYKALEEQQLGNRGKMVQESNVQTQIDIESLKAKYDSNKDELLERIMTTVCDIKPKSHINVRIE